MNNPDPENIALDAAFDRLSGRIHTLTAAFDRFGLRQDELVGRDYSEDLARIDQTWKKAREAFQNLAARPAMTLTPEAIAEQIEMAGRRVREADHGRWQSAQNQLEAVARSLEMRLGAARTRDEQNRWVGVGAGIAAILAFIAGCTIPSAVSRAAPESWHWPEKRAASQLSRDMWSAGVRMMQVADPDSWNGLARSARLYDENRTAITACEEQAQRRKKAVTCSIDVSPKAAP